MLHNVPFAVVSVALLLLVRIQVVAERVIEGVRSSRHLLLPWGERWRRYWQDVLVVPRRIKGATGATGAAGCISLTGTATGCATPAYGSACCFSIGQARSNAQSLGQPAAEPEILHNS